jgi:carboxyl-terminal processing protease
MMHDKQADLIKNKTEITLLIKNYILPRYYYQKGRIEGMLPDDPGVKKAIELLNDTDRYNGILSGPRK